MDKIPKVIHYCWFGGSKKSEKFEQYILSRKKYCPDYQIIERNESNFDINSNIYIKNAYQKKSRAFVSDYVRFYVLYHHGGIYMDTDIEVLKNLDGFLEDDFFTAMENKHQVGGSIMGSIPKHPFAREILNYYEKTDIRIIITHLMTNILQKYGLKGSQEQTVNNIHIYKSKTFYPFAYYEKYSKNCITSETYTIHRFEATRLPKYITKIIFPIIGIRKKWF